MNTIRTKLAIIFAMFMIFLVLFGILLNALFLERYYIYKNRSIIYMEASKKSAMNMSEILKTFPSL